MTDTTPKPKPKTELLISAKDETAALFFKRIKAVIDQQAKKQQEETRQ